MDLIKFNGTTGGSPLGNPEVIDGFDSITWIERFGSNGEFTLVGKTRYPFKQMLPKGTLVTQDRSTEVMIVENHEINEEDDAEPTITITGRSFETFLDNRIIGSNIAFPYVGELTEYNMGLYYPFTQAVRLLEAHVTPETMVDPKNLLPYIDFAYYFGGSSPNQPQGTEEERKCKQVPLYTQVASLLSEAKASIRAAFKNDASGIPVMGLGDRITIGVYLGNDLSSSVFFEASDDDFSSADYLWSNQNERNCALGVCKYFSVIIDSDPPKSGLERKMFSVDGSDFKLVTPGLAEIPPSTWDPYWLGYEMDRFKAYVTAKLVKQKELILVSPRLNQTRYDYDHIFRSTYFLGDIVTVRGNYGVNTKMQVTEYAETQDENGYTAVPTLVKYESSV